MTIEEFHREFKVFFDKADSSAYPEFLDGEIDIYLNEAQERIIKQRYGKNNVYRSGFEEIQKRTEDLKELVVTKFASLSINPAYQDIDDNVYEADLSNLFDEALLVTPAEEEYMFYLKASARTCKSDVTCCQWSKVKLVQHDDIGGITDDPFNKPKKGRPIIFFENGNIMIWTAPTLVVEGFQVTFLKRARLLNIGTYGNPVSECELSEHLHKELLQEAIQVALENIGSPRVQTQGPLNVQTSE
jgi:hypothetical protein